MVMTSGNHQSGTDRCQEAWPKVQRDEGCSFDIVVNIQGDEPFIAPEQIDAVARCFDAPRAQLSTLIKKVVNTEDIFNSNKPKVVVTKDREASYFSRSPIPFLRGVPRDEWLDNGVFYNHIGIYGYRTHVLEEITALPPSSLELSESLEQLRWIENGYTIVTEVTEHESFGVDTPEDLEKLSETIARGTKKPTQQL